MLALCVLAAGESRRLGTPKALVRLREEEPSTPLEWILANGSSWCDGRPVVVAGAHAREISVALDASCRTAPVPELAVNRRWRSGRTTGVLLAHARRPGFDLLVAPVDVPAVEAATFRSLAEEWRAAGAPARGWLAPYRGDERRFFGHPIVCGRDLLGDLQELGPDVPLRELRGRASRLLAVPATSDSILEDLDSPEDLLRIRARLAERNPGPRVGETDR